MRRGTRQTFTIQDPESDDELPVLRVGSKTLHPIMVELTINGKKTLMELDTGANVSITSTTTKAKLFQQENLTESSLILITYSSVQVKLAGQMLVCSVPSVIKAAIDEELDRHESAGILEKISYSKWTAPVVPVFKAEGTIRLCGNYKVTINS